MSKRRKYKRHDNYVAEMLNAIGGTQIVVARLNRRMKSRRDKLTLKAVEKWRERGSAPMKHWFALQQLAGYHLSEPEPGGVSVCVIRKSHLQRLLKAARKP